MEIEAKRARRAGLRVWNKPTSACLASRIEYGQPVTLEALSAIERGEDALRALGFRQVRVRYHREVARIEIAKDELARALTLRMFSEFTRIFKEPSVSAAFGLRFLDCNGQMAFGRVPANESAPDPRAPTLQ